MTGVLICSELGRGYGHVARAAAIARGFQRIGRSVTFATRDPALAESLSERPFARIVRAPSHAGPGAPNPTSSYAEVIADAGFGRAESLGPVVRAWIGLFDRVRPDRIICEHAPAALLAAHIAGLPAVRVGTAFVAPPPSLPSLTPWQPLLPDRQDAANRAADPAIIHVVRALGGSPIDGLSELLEGAPALLTTWPETDHFGPRPGLTLYGPLSGLGGGADPDWPNGEAPRVFVYMPFTDGRAALVIRALGKLGWPTLWHAPGVGAPDLPHNLRHVREPVNLAIALSTARLLVSRTGHGTSCEAVRAGCAQLLLPDLLEPSLLAWRLGQQRLGAPLPSDRTASAVASRMQMLIENSALQRALRSSATRHERYDPVLAADRLVSDIGALLAKQSI